MEIVQTKTSTYVGFIITEHASGIDADENDVPCIILEPATDKGVEIWIPLRSIKSRRTVIYAD